HAGRALRGADRRSLGRCHLPPDLHVLRQAERARPVRAQDAAGQVRREGAGRRHRARRHRQCVRRDAPGGHVHLPGRIHGWAQGPRGARESQGRVQGPDQNLQASVHGGAARRADRRGLCDGRLEGRQDRSDQHEVGLAPIYIQLLVTGLALGSMYGLVALGYHITWATSRTMNFSQGHAVMVGAVIAWALVVALGWPLSVGGLVTLVALAAFGILVERVAVRPFFRAASPAWLLSTIACGIIAQNVGPPLFRT